jgi:hypothetical protein
MEPLVDLAVVTYVGDMPAIERKGLLLGWVHTSAKDKARSAAAKVGGTHVVLLDQSVVGHHNMGTPLMPGLMAGEVRRYDYAVYRLDPSSWPELPELLRPKPRKLHW